MMAGTAGCTRESASSTRDSNIGGDARRTSVLVDEPSFMSSTQGMERSYYPSAASIRGSRYPDAGMESLGELGDRSLGQGLPLGGALRLDLGLAAACCWGSRAHVRYVGHTGGELDDTEAHHPVS